MTTARSAPAGSDVGQIAAITAPRRRWVVANYRQMIDEGAVAGRASSHPALAG